MAQWSDESGWAVRPNDTIPSNAILGTPLSASCENVPVGLPSTVYLNPGRFVSGLSLLFKHSHGQPKNVQVDSNSFGNPDFSSVLECLYYSYQPKCLHKRSLE